MTKEELDVTLLSNKVIRGTSTLEYIGVYAYISSLPTDQEISIQKLKQFGLCEEIVERAIKYLVRHGVIKLNQ